MKRLRLCLIVLSLLVPNFARAQQSCDVFYEVIATLFPPQFGFPTVWDAFYGDRDTMTQIASGVTHEGGTLMVLARHLDKTTHKPVDVTLAEINRRGRALMEKKHPAREGEDPIKLIATKTGYLSVSNVSIAKNDRVDRQIGISWYSKAGDFLKDQVLQDDTYDYETFGILPATDGEGFVVIAHAMSRAKDTDQHGVLMCFTSEGKQVWRRAYRVGTPNQIGGLMAIDEKNYLAMGHIKLDDGRMAGWVLKLADDGTILWQRTYPRGLFSSLRQGAISGVSATEGAGFLLIGDSMPATGDLSAAWLLALDSMGEPRWQRFYRRSDYTFSGVGVRTEDDGRIDVLLNGKAREGADGRSHIRMLTLSRRGVTIADESYIDGVHARATDFFQGWNGERIATAIVEVEDKANADALGPLPGQNPVPVEHVQIRQQGWALVASALDPYRDPCDSNGRRP